MAGQSPCSFISPLGTPIYFKEVLQKYRFTILRTDISSSRTKTEGLDFQYQWTSKSNFMIQYRQQNCRFPALKLCLLSFPKYRNMTLYDIRRVIDFELLYYYPDNLRINMYRQVVSHNKFQCCKANGRKIDHGKLCNV